MRSLRRMDFLQSSRLCICVLQITELVIGDLTADLIFRKLG